MQLNLLVLRCKNIKTSKAFYEKLGLTFVQEQHGKGPVHYSTLMEELVMELYPLTKGSEIDNIRLGFLMEIENIFEYLERETIVVCSQYQYEDKNVFVVEDPDGRKIELKSN
ncbi:MAG: Unknown protein [uncultured Sulfurovum sp.]|uniref:Glyoxalase/fosfomycin resistance/dioxygenase domain-containing protein n=1 Tax=uncultured Sulfurovum sp. TaxID=269237 RepID=A0A6S6TGU1_9BACT|nr:MAG: Unknown protein [uncultured Sulfurovum sp.]